jgi:SWI/SNF-related matrix-associated actin-dependent regulator of chromatin subfamily A3
MSHGGFSRTVAHSPSSDSDMQDRRPLDLSDLVEPPPPTELTQVTTKRRNSPEADGVQAGSSAKIDQLVNLLKLTPPKEKSLVFSQFTSFLDKVRFTIFSVCEAS